MSQFMQNMCQCFVPKFARQCWKDREKQDRVVSQCFVPKFARQCWKDREKQDRVVRLSTKIQSRDGLRMSIRSRAERRGEAIQREYSTRLMRILRRDTQVRNIVITMIEHLHALVNGV
jgi:hypothetical protein